MAKTPAPAPEAYELTVKRTFKHAGVKFQPGVQYTVKPHIYEAIKEHVAAVSQTIAKK